MNQQAQASLPADDVRLSKADREAFLEPESIEAEVYALTSDGVMNVTDLPPNSVLLLVGNSDECATEEGILDAAVDAARQAMELKIADAQRRLVEARQSS